MTSENQPMYNMSHDSGHTSLTIGLALLTGLGITLMIAALAWGVVSGDSTNQDSIGLLFLAGFSLFIVGCGAWAAVVQPWKHFDNIDVPAPDEHSHDQSHAAH